MATNVDIQSSLFVYVTDTVTGKVTRLAAPSDLQVGLADRPAELQLLGRLSLNVATFDVDANTPALIGTHDTISLINLTSSSVSSSVTAKLPGGSRRGQIHIIKDVSRTADNTPIVVSSISDGVTIDGNSTLTLSGSGASTILFWTGDEWGSLSSGGSSGGGGGSSTSGGGDPGASYIVMGLTGSLSNERVATQGTGIRITDGGANGNATFAINDNVVATVSGTRFTGNVVATTGLSGSLQNLSSGLSYLVAGNNVTITSQSNGQIIIESTGGSGSGGADVSASYVVIGATGSLPNERVATSGTGVLITDGGAGNSITFAIDDNIVATVSGARFTGDVVATAGLSGSLQNLSNGLSYLVAGQFVTITSQSNGQIIIDSTAGGGGSDVSASYVLIGNTGSLPNERALHPGFGATLVDNGSNSTVIFGVNTGTIYHRPFIKYHQDILNPVALYQFSGSSTDTSGYDTFLSSSGTPTYTASYPGLLSAWFDGQTVFCTTGTIGTQLYLTGAFSLEALCNISLTSSTQTLVSLGGLVGDTSNNDNWLFKLDVTSGKARYFHEYNSGTDVDYTFTTSSIPTNQLIHIALTRNASYVVKLYVNGCLIETTPTLITASLGGSPTTRLMIGGTNTAAGTGFSHFTNYMISSSIASLVLYDSERSANEILSDFRNTVAQASVQGLYNIEPEPRSRITSSFSIDSHNRFTDTIGSDVFFFVSGTQNITGSTRRVTVFGGDVVFSGTTSGISASGVYNDSTISGSTVKATMENMYTRLDFENLSTGSYTFSLNDVGKKKRFLATVTASIPNTSSVAWVTGSVIYGRQAVSGTNLVFLTGSSGVTLNTDYFKTRAQHSEFALHYVGDNAWDVMGDLS